MDKAPVVGLQTDTRQAAAVSGYSWAVLLILAAVNSVNYMDRWVMSVLIEPIKHDFGLSDTQLGLLTGLAFSLGYALMALPIARVSDSGSRRNVLVGAITMWSVMTAMMGMAQSYWHLLLARIGVGIGEAGCIPTGQSLISDYFPRDRRAFALSVFSAGSMLGKVLGIGGAGFLLGRIGWHSTLLAMAVPGLFMALIVRLVVREPVRGRFDVAPQTASEGPFATIRTLLRIPSYGLIVCGLATSNLVIFGVQNWSPAFYMRVHGLSPLQVGAAIATVVGVGSAVGLLAGGYVMQGLMRRNPCWALRVGCGTQAVAGLCSVASFLVGSPSVSLAAFAATSIIVNLSSGGIIAAKLDIVDPRARSMAAAFSMMVVSLIGLGLGPLFVGALSDLFNAGGDGPQALRRALVLTAALNGIPAILYLAASRTLARDVAARHGAATTETRA